MTLLRPKRVYTATSIITNKSHRMAVSVQDEAGRTNRCAEQVMTSRSLTNELQEQRAKT